jgi:hypothetical protein
MILVQYIAMLKKHSFSRVLKVGKLLEGKSESGCYLYKKDRCFLLIWLRANIVQID